MEFQKLEDVRKAIFDVPVPIGYDELLELSKRIAEQTIELQILDERKKEVSKTLGEQIKMLQASQRATADKLETGKKIEKQPVEIGHDYRDLSDGRTLGTKWVKTLSGDLLGPFAITEADMAAVPKTKQTTIAGVSICISCQEAATNVTTIAGEPVCSDCFRRISGGSEREAE